MIDPLQKSARFLKSYFVLSVIIIASVLWHSSRFQNDDVFYFEKIDGYPNLEFLPYHLGDVLETNPRYSLLRKSLVQMPHIVTHIELLWSRKHLVEKRYWRVNSESFPVGRVSKYSTLEYSYFLSKDANNSIGKEFDTIFASHFFQEPLDIQMDLFYDLLKENGFLLFDCELGERCNFKELSGFLNKFQILYTSKSKSGKDIVFVLKKVSPGNDLQPFSHSSDSFYSPQGGRMVVLGTLSKGLELELNPTTQKIVKSESTYELYPTPHTTTTTTTNNSVPKLFYVKPNYNPTIGPTHFIWTASIPLSEIAITCIESFFYHNPNVPVILHVLKMPQNVTFAQYFVSKGYNFAFHHIYDPLKYLRDSPLQLGEALFKERYFTEKINSETQITVISHISDLLRYKVLYDFGGRYLDTDALTLRSLSSLKNCIGRGRKESPVLYGGVIFFQKRHPVISRVMRAVALRRDYGWASLAGPNFNFILGQHYTIDQQNEPLGPWEPPSILSPSNVVVMPYFILYPIAWNGMENGSYSVYNESHQELYHDIINYSYSFHIYGSALARSNHSSLYQQEKGSLIEMLTSEYIR